MPTQLDFSLLETVKDPELRATAERLGRLMAASTDEQEEAMPPLPKQTAKIIQFPIFPETTRPISNDMARSALFSCVQGKDRQFIRESLLATVNGVEIRFTGEQLNQDDHDLLMQLVFIAHKEPIGAWVTVPAYAILTALGRQVGGKQYRELHIDILRLTAGTVSLRNAKAEVSFMGHHLIAKAKQDERTHRWVYRLDPDLATLYGDMTHTLIDWDQRLALKGKDLARWLQLYIASHAKPYPIKVETLRMLSGSRAKALKHFRSMLRVAMADLVSNGDIAHWTIEMPSDLLYVDRGVAASASQKRHMARRNTRT